MKRTFDLGAIVMTQGVENIIERSDDNAEEMLACLLRHARCDWGDMCDEDKLENEYGLQNGGRLFSQYNIGEDKTKIWIITEWDRSYTTILLPEEY
jgi:hypothetical protein